MRVRWGATIVGLGLLAHLAVHGERARACGGGWGPDKFVQEISFDPGVLGDTEEALFYEPYSDGYGETCYTCLATAAVDEWTAYLAGTTITKDQVQTLLEKATATDFAALVEKLAPPATPPKKPAKLAAPIAALPFLAAPMKVPTLVAAFEVLGLARRIEHYASYDDEAKQPGKPPSSLLKEALAGQQAAGADAFLAQRYAFLALRVKFYRADWKNVIKDADAAVLAGPSLDLHWRARWYVAGAQKHLDHRAVANLELATIGASYPPLAGMASHDFSPVEDTDWRASLKAAATPQAKALVWRMVGIKHDGLAAVAEIQKLDPTSSAIPLLLVRELERAEGMISEFADPDSFKVDADSLKTLAKIEKLAAAAIAAPGANRPWVDELVLGHIAAIRGDVAGTRLHAGLALQAHPGDKRVANQTHASLAIALIRGYKISPATEAALAAEYVAGIDSPSSFGYRIRGILAPLYLKANRHEEAELLYNGYDSYSRGEPDRRLDPKQKWDSAFLLRLLDRVEHPASDFDKLATVQSYSYDQLHKDIAMAYVAEGKFADASKAYADWKIPAGHIVTTPYVLHVKECFDCDGITFKSNEPGLIHELVALDVVAQGKDKKAAAAALKIGTALYNFTRLGSTTWMYWGTHALGYDATGAQTYAKRAYDLSKDPEQKAAAAWLGAKAEVEMVIGKTMNADIDADVNSAIAKTWYPRLRKLEQTKYVQDVLAECGWYADWRRAQP